mmetsp:Transcript_110978/g.320744  ORF Transcript_110978/g.320744 Transcript_110978/m.320744 type:complete len:350 (-) Transcript_110978:138-1187(-)
MLRISRRVSVETVSVDLKDSRSLALADVVDDSLSSLSNLSSIHTVNEETGDSVVLSLLKDIAVPCNIRSESVDGTSVIDDQQQQRQVVLGSSVQQFGSASILGTTFSNENNSNAVIISGRRNILLFISTVIGNLQFTVQQDALGGTSGVGKLFANQRPSTLKVVFLVEDVHRTTSSTARTSVLHEQFGHNLTGVHSGGNSVSVLTVVGKLLIFLLDSIFDQSRDRFLSIIEVHKSTDLSLHVLLITGILKATGHLHGTVQFHQILFVGVKSIVVRQISRRIAKVFHQLSGNTVPRKIDGRSHDGGLRLFSGSRCFDYSRHVQGGRDGDIFGWSITGRARKGSGSGQANS